MNRKNTRLYLNALGIVNGLGTGREEVLRNLQLGVSKGITTVTGYSRLGEVVVAKVDRQLPVVDSKLSKYDCRNNQLMLAALKDIENEVAELIASVGADRIGVVLGSSTSGIWEVERALLAKRDTDRYPDYFYDYKQEMGAVAEFLATYLGLKSVAITISTACSSSAKVFATARVLIESNFCDAVLVGGSDSLCQLTLDGFHSLEALSDSVCNPFSVHRRGITIGEGAALFILSRESTAIELCGIGESSDAHHMSAPHPEGIGAGRAMRQCLVDAEITPEEVTYLNLHGTATVLNDQMESRAVHAIFGNTLLCSSTKALTGHTLGAAGAIELGLCWLTVSKLNTTRILPPHVWDAAKDEMLEPLNFVKVGTTLPNDKKIYAMSNSFAFGGSNVSVVIGSGEAAYDSL